MKDRGILAVWAATLACAGLAAALPARAQESAAFLKIGAGARAIAMGDAFTAVADDADALYWNPSGLALVGRPQVTAGRAQMFLGDAHDSLNLAVPLGSQVQVRRQTWSNNQGNQTAVAVYDGERSRGVLGLGFSRLAQTPQEGRDAERNRTGSFGASDMAFSLAYARPLGGGLQAGLALKRIESRIADASAGTLAADLGLQWRLGSGGRWQWGAAARNVGPGLRFAERTSPLPLTFATGLARRVGGSLLLSAEVRHRPYAGRTTFSIGTEYSLLSALSLRAGYNHQQSAAGAGSPLMGGLGGGLGLRWGRFAVDYALTPFGELGNVQRLSLRAGF
ncbi:MAG TPA: hypothetical protein DD417_02835 [Elusimicrobia bacterium]|nr:hypothetical protein [Elusimicrobiota bacterium]